MQKHITHPYSSIKLSPVQSFMNGWNTFNKQHVTIPDIQTIKNKNVLRSLKFLFLSYTIKLLPIPAIHETNITSNNPIMEEIIKK